MESARHRLSWVGAGSACKIDDRINKTKVGKHGVGMVGDNLTLVSEGRRCSLAGTMSSPGTETFNLSTPQYISSYPEAVFLLPNCSF